MLNLGSMLSKVLCQTAAHYLFHNSKELAALPHIYHTQILAVVLLIHILWDVPGLPDPDDEGIIGLQNPGNYLSKHSDTSQEM